MSVRLIPFLFLATLVRAQPAREQCTTPVEYENKNQVDPPALSLWTLSGRVIDFQGVTIPDACLAMFREKDKKLVRAIVANRNGRFSIRGLRKGRYRLLVKVRGFCPANSKLVVGSKKPARRVVVHMKPQGIDSCSFIDTK